MEYGTFRGEFENHSFKQGLMTYLSGWTYDGSWTEGAKHGKGCDSSNEKPHGKKTRGSTYKGDFEYNLRHGQGTMDYPYGDKFVGLWAGDKRRRGLYTFAPSPVPAPVAPKRKSVEEGGRKSEDKDRHLFSVLHTGNECVGCGVKMGACEDWFRSNEKPFKDLCVVCYEAGKLPNLQFTDMGVIQARFPWGCTYDGEFNSAADMHGEGKLSLTDGSVKEGFWDRNEFLGNQPRTSVDHANSSSQDDFPTQESYNIRCDGTESSAYGTALEHASTHAS
eukprot:Hpha_TRINITY_DN10871_c0_g2::TRINITY_DN10871_c0_g2_i1::g.23451::m.23451